MHFLKIPLLDLGHMRHDHSRDKMVNSHCNLLLYTIRVTVSKMEMVRAELGILLNLEPA
jgi:hypothetical protein